MKKSILKRNLKRKFKPIKPIRKHSKNPYRIAQNKADKALQDFYQVLGLKCEVCGEPANLVHHFIEKSQSTNLRFCGKNLVPLCTSCHCKHHLRGDPAIHATILFKRGKKWYNWIQKNREIKKKYTLDELRELALFYRKLSV